MNYIARYKGVVKHTSKWVEGSLVEHPNGEKFILVYRTSGEPEWHQVFEDTLKKI